MKLYDRLAGQWGLEPSRSLSREETLQLIPTLEPEGLQGGVRYYDGQFDDARLAVHLARTVVDHGGWVLNYARVAGLLKEGGRVAGVVVEEGESGRTMEVRARVVINATGVFCDAVRQMDDAEAVRVIQVSQGAHVVLPRSFLPGSSAIMVPHPLTDASCSPCRGTIASLWAPRTRRRQSRRWSRCRGPMSWISSWATRRGI